MQAGNTQSEQFSNLQQTVPIQSKSTQPKALNPNQLNPGLTLTVTGPPSAQSQTQTTPPGDAIWPFVILVILAAVSILGFILFILRSGELIPAEEEQTQPVMADKKRKNAKKKSRKKRNQK